MNEQVKAKLQHEIQDLRDRLQQAEAKLRAFSPDTVEAVKNLSQIERQTRQRIPAQVALQESEARFRNAFDYAGIGKSTEDQLRQHQQHLQYLLTSSPAVIFSTQPDPNYKLTYISENVANILGYAAQEFLNGANFWLNHIHPEDINLILQELPQRLKRGNYSFEYRFRHEDGTYRWLLDEGKLIRDEKGQPIEVVGYFVDISDRKQAELALSRSRELKEAIFNESTDALFLVDPNTGLTIDCNQSAVDLFETANEDELINIEGHTLQKSRFTPEELASINHAINKYGLWSKEVEYITKKGKHFWGNLAVKQIHIADKAINLVRVTDITARKETEKELKLQAVIMKNMAEGICLVSATDGIIVYANPKFEQMFGYERGELKNQPVSIINYADDEIDAETTRQTITQKIIGQGEYTYKIHNVKKDGTPFWCQATTSRFEHPDYGTVMVAVQQDITVQKQTQDQLQASLKEKEVLLKEIHHRVKNNLQIVSSLLQMQSRRTKDEDVALVLQDSQNRIASIALVHEKLYRSENLSQIDFAQYVPDLITHLFDSYNISSSQVRMSYQVEDIALAIDTAIPCGLILNELVSNALKYAFPEHQKGEIQIKFLRNTDDSLTLNVRDNGVGIPKSFDIETTPSLGLTLVLGLVDQIDGTLDLNRDSGTEFTITFNHKLRTR